MTRFKLPTQVAQARWGDNTFRGYSVDRDLAGSARAWDAVALAVGHHGLDSTDAAVLDDIVVCALAADPRIWPLKVVRLLSAYGHATTGTVAGIYCTEAARVGWRAYFIAGELLAELVGLPDQVSRRSAVEARLARGQTIPGYGVAHRDHDERATAFARCLRERGRTTRQHWMIAQEVDALLAPKGIRINMGAAGAAAMLDLGFTLEQLLALGPHLVLPNYLANAVEGAEQAPQILRTLPAEAIEDRTPPARLSPRAQAKRK